MTEPVPWKAAALAFACMLALPIVAAEHELGMAHGELTVTLQRGEGDCDDAYLAGRHIGAAEGTIDLYAGGEGVLAGPIASVGFTGEAEAEGDGFSFEAGPFEIADDSPPGYVFVVSWGHEETYRELHVVFRGDCGEEDAIDETCVGYALGIELADGTHRFDDDLCITGAQPADCLAYALFVQVNGTAYVASDDLCGAGNDFPDGEECIAFGLALTVNGEDAVLLDAGECDAPEGCVGFFVLGVLLDDVVYTFFGSDEGCEPAFVEPPCEGADVTATTEDDGSVTLTWDVEGAASTEIWRDGELVDTVEGNTFVDADTEAGVTYRYEILFLDEEGMPFFGACVEVTAVPFFGAPALAALAGLGCVGAYVAMRRRA